MSIHLLDINSIAKCDLKLNLIHRINLLMKTGFDAGFSKSNANSTGSAVFAQDKRKVVSNLESMLKAEIEKREDAENQLADYRRRSLYIERQFKRLLQKYDNHVAMINGQGSYGQQTWDKLAIQIEKFNTDSQRMLEKRCNQIEFMMTRRINEILEKTQVEIKKNKKLSEQQYSQVKEQIKEALKIAKEIEAQNQIFKRQNKDLLFKVSILKEQKNLLISELNQKKLKLKSLMVAMYQQDNKSSLASPATSRVRSKHNSTQQYSPTPKFICEPSFRDVKSSIQNPQGRRISLSRQRRDKNQIILKTDNHFKLCLDRERRKNVELKGIIVKLHHKIKEATALIQNSFHQKQAIVKTQLVKFYESLVDNIKFKLFVSNGKDQSQAFTSSQLSRFLQN